MLRSETPSSHRTPFSTQLSFPYHQVFESNSTCSIPHMIIKHLGIKEAVPPYSDKRLGVEELRTGVSFASAGTGFDPLTSQLTNVIPLSKLVEYFKEYQQKMGATIGKAQTQNLINQALFFVSIGSNDFIENYKLVPIRSLNYTVSAYIDFLLQHAQQFLQELLDEGVRKIAVTGLGPLGCLPSIITVHSENAFSKRECVDSISSMAREFNVKIQKQLKATQNKFANLGSRIGYVEVYKPTMDILLRPKSHGE
ncbi:hypothetical protein T459_24946 [Capsicum annuum]|uniref:GDSL esterase/lipase At5g45960-like n=1 Tax=Capsicum annuum TaxID=4072 RepID=A0A2G2YJA8_CAPAN|nr:hypothetical protein T459_24946 [Capsicum annuum]